MSASSLSVLNEIPRFRRSPSSPSFPANSTPKIHLRNGCSSPSSVHQIWSNKSTTRSCSRKLFVRVSSSDEGPSKEVEDPKFVPLKAEEPIYGPPALLLLGFDRDETLKVLQFLEDFDGEFLQVIRCTEDMLSVSVWEAMHIQQSNLESVEIAKSLPRMCILSGLSGEEMLMFIDAFTKAGFEPSIFAALVPNSANKLLGEVVAEIIGDHEMMSLR